MNLRTRLERLQRTAKDHQHGHEAYEALRAALQRGRARVDAWRRAEATNAGTLAEYELEREVQLEVKRRYDAAPATIAAHQSGDIVAILRGRFRRGAIERQVRGEREAVTV
jgi:hypothetical protein